MRTIGCLVFVPVHVPVYVYVLCMYVWAGWGLLALLDRGNSSP